MERSANRGAHHVQAVETAQVKSINKETEMEKNICLSCRFAFRNGKCNRLVVSSMGMNDRLGSYYKKDNK